jgi:hypothetical protein
MMYVSDKDVEENKVLLANGGFLIEGKASYA